MKALANRTAVVAAAAVVVLAAAVFAQGRGARPGGGGGAAAAQGAFDPRDFSGLWARNLGFLGLQENCRDCGDRGYSHEWPVLTPAGQKEFEGNKPARGRTLGSADAAAHPEEHIGRRRAVPPAESNDLQGGCNPLGLLRHILYSPAPMEIVQTPDRMLQFFEWTWDHREVWMDGRTLPDPAEYIPRWNGYSVGRWDRNTFIVDSVGFDDRGWVDHHGYPHSEELRVQERWRRISGDTLELAMTITDPTVYAKPWVSETKRWKLIPKEKMQIAGWSGLLEEKCVPIDEVDTFNKLIRDPAAGLGK